MKQVIKNIMYGAGAAALTMPMMVGAQFTKPQGTNLPDNSIYEILRNGMNWLLGLVGIVGVIGFAISGLMYLTAAGDEGRIEKAKEAMLYSIIGVVVALVGLVALGAASGILGGSNTKI